MSVDTVMVGEILKNVYVAVRACVCVFTAHASVPARARTGTPK